jgi:hypothetical protein
LNLRGKNESPAEEYDFYSLAYTARVIKEAEMGG